MEEIPMRHRVPSQGPERLIGSTFWGSFKYGIRKEEKCQDTKSTMELQKVREESKQKRAFPATAQGPAAGKAESINPVSAR
ncbi:hypothetical protein DSO57_1004140 [Entomophthora muscae]|uniref:Uncharacterized protein n=1 Tax=Entomophthora muscae TaxID=34485 RepID=A0ACC2TJC8_9FUNG|nr:hypothetical protein DSO57_1004140 [Entomophthora muscae]